MVIYAKLLLWYKNEEINVVASLYRVSNSINDIIILATKHYMCRFSVTSSDKDVTIL